MPLRLLPALLLGAALAGGCALTGCAPEPEMPASPVAERAPAPAVVFDTEAGPVSLTRFVGRPVVVQLAPADDAGAWAALADALADLEAGGAVVLAVKTDTADPAVAEAFGFDGTAVAVVVDGAGTVRGRTAPTSGDALFDLAGPVLAEADVASTVAWAGADSLGALVRSGGVIVDLGAEVDYPHALRVDAAAFSAESLPADLGTPLAFVGPEADAAAAAAASWGYVSVYVADADGALTPVEGAPPPSVGAPSRPGGVRG